MSGMSISPLLEMAVSGDPDRLAVVSGDIRLTTRELSDLAAVRSSRASTTPVQARGRPDS